MSAGSCTWDEVILVRHTNCGRRGWREALQKEIWGFRLITNWIWVNGASWQPKGPRVSWGASGTAPPGSWRRVTVPLCSGAASHWVLCLVLGTIIQGRSKAIKEHPDEDNQDGERPQDQDLWGMIEVPLFAQFGEDWGETSLQSSTSSRWALEREVLISLWWPVTGYEEMKIYLNKTWFEEHFCKLSSNLNLEILVSTQRTVSSKFQVHFSFSVYSACLTNSKHAGLKLTFKALLNNGSWWLKRIFYPAQ